MLPIRPAEGIALFVFCAGQFLLQPRAAVAQLPIGFTETVVFSGLNGPTALEFAADGRVFVAERSGIIKVFDNLNDPTPTIFADLSSPVMSYWDRGLLGLALHPDFPTTPYVYVLYAVDAPLGGVPPVYNDACPDPTGAGCIVSGRLSRLTADGDTWTGTEDILIWDWCQQHPSHSIGTLAFGLDGALYVTGGDGASFVGVDFGNTANPCSDPQHEGGALRSQDLRTAADPVTFDGAVLRLDPLTGLALPDNPLIGGDPDDDRIVAYGLRNPFRMTVHPATGELWIGDVGWNTWEELNRIPDPTDTVVENFGWPCYEGFARQSAYDAANLPICETLYGESGAITPPHYAYRHGTAVIHGDGCTTGGSAISGLAFYDGANYPPEYHGALFLCDYARGCIWVMRAGPDGLPDPGQLAPFRSGATQPVTLKRGPSGDIYYVTLNGTVRRFEYTPANTPPIAAFTATPTFGPAPLTVDFDAAASIDPDGGGPLSFSWDLDGDGQFGDSDAISPTFVYQNSGPRLVTLRVTDADEASDTESLLISVDDSPPMATIDAPPPTRLWRVGDEIAFAGSAVDPETGPLAAGDLAWSVVLHHCHHDDPLDCHAHAVQEFAAVDAGSFVAPDHEYPAHLELRLTATDHGPGNWWDRAWTRRARLTFDATAFTENLIDFPVPLQFNAVRIDYAQVQDAGQDLRFVDADGTTVLAHEVETWDEAGTSAVWVRVPQITSGSASDFIWVYYGNPAAPAADDAPAVWTAGYRGVWHLAGDAVDATGLGHDGVDFGTVAAPGVVGGSRAFNGAEYIEVAHADDIMFTAADSYALTALVYVPAVPDQWTGVVTKSRDVWPWYGIWINYDNLWCYDTPDYFCAGEVGLGWTHVAMVFDAAAGVRTLYVDGAAVGTGAPVDVNGTGLLWFGGAATTTEFLTGRVDEVRIASVARSATWVAAEYRALHDNLLSYGPIEAFGTQSATVSRILQPDVVELQFETVPPGLAVTVYGESHVAPFQRSAIVNAVTTIGVASPQALAGVIFDFVGWSDGGAPSHELTVAPLPEVLVATFAARPTGGADVNCDGVVDFFDIDPFLLALFDPAGYVLAYPTCDPLNADVNGDGTTDFFDIDPFLAVLFG